MAKIHPEGTLHFLLGQLHFVAGRYEQAEKAFGRVQDVNVIFPAVKREASFSTMMAQVSQGFEQDDQKLQAAVDTIREHLKSRPISRLHSKYAGMVLLQAGEFELAELAQVTQLGVKFTIR